MEMKFYICPTCGQIIAEVKRTNADLICCGGAMKEIIALTEDVPAIKDKHLPVITYKGNKVIVRIGMFPHPMSKEHFIHWIAIKTNKGNQRKELKPGDFPKAEFFLDKNELVLEVYAYCNLHSLWKKEIVNENDEDCKECEIKGLKK